MKKSLQTKTLKRGMAATLVLLLTLLSIHSCKQERLQPEQQMLITAGRNKIAGLKSNSQKSLQSIPQSSLAGGACYFAIPRAFGNVSGPTGPNYDMVKDYIQQQLDGLCSKQFQTRQDAQSEYNSVNNACYMYALNFDCNWSVGVLYDPVQQVCPGDEGFVIGGVVPDNVDPLQAYNKICSSSFVFSQVVAPGDGSRGWKESSVKDLTINVMASNYFEHIWNTITGGTIGKFNLTVGVPGDLPSANVSKETAIALNKAMVDIYRSYGSEGVKGLINTGRIGTTIAALAQIQLGAVISGARVSASLSNRVTPTSPIIGVNCQ